MPRRRLALAAILIVVAGCGGQDGGASDSGASDFGASDSGAPAEDAGQDAGAPDVREPDPEPYVCGDTISGAARERLGNADDTLAQPNGRIVLMGGSSEVDAHSDLFVEGASGGDVLVLRASGSVSSYTPYFFDELPFTPAPASSETIRLDDPQAGEASPLLCRVAAAEALWLAGGDQFDYVGRWPAVLHDALHAGASRGAAIGGTSAGAMVWGEFVFDAALGSVTSDEALFDPLAGAVAVVPAPFGHPELANHVVDTHFSAREREGRLLVFMARASQLTDQAVVRGIGLDERASLSVRDGTFTVATGAIGRAVFIYEMDASVTLSPGAALNVGGVSRRRLPDGASGAWPVPLDTPDVDSLDVVDGVVTVSP